MLSWFRTRLADDGNPQLWLNMADRAGLRSVTIVRTWQDQDGQEHETVEEEMNLGGAFEALRYRTMLRLGEYRVMIMNVNNERYFSDVLVLIEDVDGNGVPDTMTNADGQVTFLEYENAFSGK